MTSKEKIERPCAISVTQLRKAVTAARRANYLVGPARREELLLVAESHADAEDDFKEVSRKFGRVASRVKKILGEENLTIPVLRAIRTKIKQTFHPPVSQMKYQALIEYVYG